MKGRLQAEMEVVRQRIQDSQFNSLKIYPNKSLLGKSKPLRFKNNSYYFEERCSLFVEYAYLLLRVQLEKKPVFVSQNIFINHFGQVYLFYSFDPQHEGRLAKISPGPLVASMIAGFYRVFPPCKEPMEDSQQLSLYENTVHSLITYLEELQERSENYYYQYQESNAENCDFRCEPSNPYSLLLKLESSQLFKETSFSLKFTTAVLARGLIEHSLGTKLLSEYLNLCDEQEKALSEAHCTDTPAELHKCVSAFCLSLLRFLQLLQKESFLKVTVSQSDLLGPGDRETGCTLTFQSNLRREAAVNKTSNQKSSESSIPNECSKQEKEKLLRMREELESLSIFKNKINFTVRVFYNRITRLFELQMEALSLWTVDEIYFYNFHDYWRSLIDGWQQMMPLEAVHERVGTLKLEVFHKNKNVGVRTLVLAQRRRVGEQLVVAYDQLVTLLLLVEPLLKRLYKMGYQLVTLPSMQLHSSHIHNHLARLAHALKTYSHYYRALLSLRRH